MVNSPVISMKNADKWANVGNIHLEYLQLQSFLTLMCQVRSVKMHSCRDLLVGLDITGINPSTVPFTLIHSSRLTIDFITFDKSVAVNQKLVTQFHNIESVSFQGLHVDEAIEVTFSKPYDILLETYKTRKFLIKTTKSTN